MSKRVVVCWGDGGENEVAVIMPPQYDGDSYAVSDMRDLLEDLGYETKGTLELISLAEAKRRAKRTADDMERVADS